MEKRCKVTESRASDGFTSAAKARKKVRSLGYFSAAVGGCAAKVQAPCKNVPERFVFNPWHRCCVAGRDFDQVLAFVGVGEDLSLLPQRAKEAEDEVALQQFFFWPSKGQSGVKQFLFM